MMKEEEFRARYRDEMDCVRVSPQLRQQTLDRISQKEAPIMKRKMSAALVFVIALTLCAAALATTRLGILDFARRYTGMYLPGDAQSYVQQDVLSMENELVTVSLRELYYDGFISRMTVDVKPKSGRIMLLGEDISMDDPWINMTPMNIEFNKTYTQTVRDVYLSGGYEAAYITDAELLIAGDHVDGLGDYQLNEDGTLTLYKQLEYESYAPRREAQLQLTLLPYKDTLEQLDTENRVDLTQPVVMEEAVYESEIYQNTAPVDFPEVGVRVDQLTLNIRAQEIHATLDFTVTDAEKYAAFDGGLWFEFIDPESKEIEPYAQRLMAGLTGGGSIAAINEDTTRYRQSESLGRNELHETYTLRAYNAWEKERYETHAITVEKVK